MATDPRLQTTAVIPGTKGVFGRLSGSAGHSFSLLRTSRTGMVGLFLLVFFVVVALFAPWIALQDPSSPTSFSTDVMGAPSLHPLHPLGTDETGRDIYSLLVYGTRISLTVGVAAALVSSVIGGFVGIVAGYSGGWLDNILTAIDDWFLVIPFLPLAIVLVSLLERQAASWPGGKLGIIIMVIGITGWAGTSRIIRSQVLSTKERTFVERSRALGAGRTWVLRKQILPNVLPLIFANTVLIIAISILSESTLSFLGLGDLSKPSWGTMLDTANSSGAVAQGSWWYFIPPGICICLLVMGFTLVGYAIEEIINPRLRGAALTAVDTQVLLDVRDLAVAYKDKDGREVRLIDGVTFQLRRGEALGLAGESGCGKTTTALSLLGLLPENLYRAEGTVDISSTRGVMHVHRRTERGLRDMRWNTVSIVFQGAMNALDPVVRVSDQISEAIELHDPGMTDADVKARIADLFGYVGINPNRATQYPHEFSGGMRQRVMIALALACNPELIIGDEPTTALDVMMQAQILELLENLRRDFGLSMILITHDLSVLAETCDRVAIMYGGQIAESGPVEQLYRNPQHPYTQRLLGSFPTIGGPRELAPAIPGVPPDPADVPAGCRFSPRCHRVQDRCLVETVEERALGDDRSVRCLFAPWPEAAG